MIKHLQWCRGHKLQRPGSCYHSHLQTGRERRPPPPGKPGQNLKGEIRLNDRSDLFYDRYLKEPEQHRRQGTRRRGRHPHGMGGRKGGQQERRHHQVGGQRGPDPAERTEQPETKMRGEVSGPVTL